MLWQTELFFSIAGDMGVGKSCLLHQFTEKKCKTFYVCFKHTVVDCLFMINILFSEFSNKQCHYAKFFFVLINSLHKPLCVTYLLLMKTRACMY